MWFVERERSESVNGVQVWHGSEGGALKDKVRSVNECALVDGV